MSDFGDDDEDDDVNEPWRNGQDPDDEDWGGNWEGDDAGDDENFDEESDFIPLDEELGEVSDHLFENPFPDEFLEGKPGIQPQDFYEITGREIEEKILDCPAGFSHLHRQIILTEVFQISSAGKPPSTPSLAREKALEQIEEMGLEVPGDSVEESQRMAWPAYHYDEEKGALYKILVLDQTFETAASMEELQDSPFMGCDVFEQLLTLNEKGYSFDKTLPADELANQFLDAVDEISPMRPDIREKRKEEVIGLFKYLKNRRDPDEPDWGSGWTPG
jgi:hypothetical protein